MIQRMAMIGLRREYLLTLQLNIQVFYPIADWLEFMDGLEFIKYCLADRQLPEIIFADLFTPKIDGIALTDYVNTYLPGLRVVLLVNDMDSRTVDAAAAVGTKGLICKSDICTFFSIKHAGPDKYYPDTITIKGLTESFCTVPTELFKHKQAIFTKYGITKRESMFLLLNPMGLDYREIAEIMFISVKTVDNLFNRVSKKLGTLNRHALTLFCIRMGLVKVATVQTGTH